MQTRRNEPLVSCDWLAGKLADPGLVILDATFFLPAQGRNAAQEFLAEHLPGAQFFDIDAIADRTDPLPHMQPSPAFFAAAASRFGIDDDIHVVVYDNNAFMAAARVWWTFRLFGHDCVSVLDGGLKHWKSCHHPVAAGAAAAVPPREFRARYRPELVRDLDRMRQICGGSSAAIVDARSSGRFAGTEPEPRAGVRSGHIPGSLNLPYKRLVDESTGLMKTPAAIAAEWRAAGIEPTQPVVTTCGTGVTAAILALSLFLLGRDDVPVYDGSWTEWGGRRDTPVA